MIFRRGLLAVILVGLSLGSAAQTVAPVTAEEADDDLPPLTLPSAAENGDPDSLNRRLAYAQSLAEAKGGDCTARLNDVQAQLDGLTGDPTLDIIVPDARARLASAGYRLHLGRAACGSEAAPRKEELQTALGIAQGAISLYRDLYDYRSATVMQYNVAATWHMLGDNGKAVEALEAAIVMDRDFGFADDAAENGALLQRWNAQASSPAAFPKRSITLKFGWGPSEGDVEIAADAYDLLGKSVIHSHGAATLKRRIRADGPYWMVEHQREKSRYNFEEWGGKGQPSRARNSMIAVIADLMPADFLIGGKGAFKKTIDADAAGGAVASDLAVVARDFPSVEDASLDMTTMLGTSLRYYLKPEGVESKSAEDYSLAVSAWNDTTMEQGVWYDMNATLYVPGIALGMEHDISFSYSRPAPCSPDAPTDSCAEILVHATPNADSQESEMDTLTRALKLQRHNKGVQFSSATDLRLIVDPATLRPFVAETRRHWYLAIEGEGEPLIGSQKTVATYSYH